jgi:hypothetical protein
MFCGQDSLEITFKLMVTPLKITKVIDFHSQCVFTYTFSLDGDTFLKIGKNCLLVKSFLTKNLERKVSAFFFGSERERNFATERERKISERVQV